MKSFYTFVDRVGHRLFTRYVDVDGQRKTAVVGDHPFELFIKGNRQDSVSLLGEPLSRVEFSSVNDMLEFKNNHASVSPIYGQTNPVHQYIATQFPGELQGNMSKLVILNFDIEVEHSQGFPEPWPAAQEILSITYKVFGKPGFVTFGTKPFSVKNPDDQYIRCANETDLLLQFLSHWKTISPDIVTGWNIAGFDIPYIINRMKTLLGDKTTSQLSPFSKQTERVFRDTNVGTMGRDSRSYRILGVNILDYMTLYMKFAPKKLESYRLDYVAEVEVKANKVDLSPWGGSLMRLYEEDYDTFVDYNQVDVHLVEKIDSKLAFIQTVVTIALLTHSQYHEALASVKPWDNLIYNMLLADGIQIPPDPTFSNLEEGGIAGAFVKEPAPGAYRWVVSLDLAALYPSIFQMYNMSPETIMVKAAENPKAFLDSLLSGMGDVNDRIARGWVTAANGASFAQDRIGILPRAMKMLLSGRKKIKRQMLDEKRKIEGMSEDDPMRAALSDHVSMLDALQNAYKILANSGYGAAANLAFRYFDVNIAEGTTLTGQLTIRFISDKLNVFLNERFRTTGIDYVIANDTDSAYVRLDDFVRIFLQMDPANVPANKKNKVVDAIDAFVKREIDPVLEREFAALADMVGSTNNTMDMKREAIADIAVFRGKKNYIMQVFDQEGVRYAVPEIKTVGVEAQRTSTPKMIREQLKKCYGIMLNAGEDAIHREVKEFREKFFSVGAEMISYPRGVSDISKWIEKNGSLKKGTPINTRAAVIYNELVNEKGLQGVHPLVKESDKIKFIYLRQPNPIRSNVIGFISTLPPEFGLDAYIDREKMWEGMFVGPLESFTRLLGYGHKTESSLDDLWA